MFVDSHCHLNKLNLDLYQNALDIPLQQARDNRVSHMLCIGVDLETTPEVLAIAEQHSNVYATVGTHPLYGEGQEPTLEILEAYAEHPKVVGIGETGLDFHYGDKTQDHQQQQDRFAVHIQAARRTGLPLIVHTRNARAETLALIEAEGAGQVQGILHCFTESLDMAERAVELGFYISISGIVTFRNAQALRDVVAALPLDKLLIETDAPWLAPVPYRGKENQPAYVVEVANKIAEIKECSVEEVAQVTTDNFFTLFRKAKRA